MRYFVINATMGILWRLSRHFWGNLYAHTQLFMACKYIMVFRKLMTFSCKQNALQNLLGIHFFFLFFPFSVFLPFVLKASQMFLSLKEMMAKIIISNTSFRPVFTGENLWWRSAWQDISWIYEYASKKTFLYTKWLDA